MSCILAEAGAVVGATVQLETIFSAVYEGIVISLDRTNKVLFLLILVKIWMKISKNSSKFCSIPWNLLKFQVLIVYTHDETSGKPMMRLFNANNLKSVRIFKKFI